MRRVKAPKGRLHLIDSELFHHNIVLNEIVKGYISCQIRESRY